MKTVLRIYALAVVGLACSGLLVSGCKSTPNLTKDTAQALIQSHYDSQQASGVTINVDKKGLQQGLAAGYWKLTKYYPNQPGWADYTLTPEGKKVLKLTNGGDVIEWRPGANGEFRFLIVTQAATTLRAKDVQDPQDEILPNVNAAKSVTYTESLDLKSVPQPLQDMAHNPGNRLSSKRQADLSYEGGTWKVHGIV